MITQASMAQATNDGISHITDNTTTPATFMTVSESTVVLSSPVATTGTTASASTATTPTQTQSSTLSVGTFSAVSTAYTITGTFLPFYFEKYNYNNYVIVYHRQRSRAALL